MNLNNWQRLPINPCACGCGVMVAKKFKKGHGRRRPLLDRLMEKVDRSGTCWLWRGALDPAGYGRIGVDGNRTALAHRVSYELHVGPIPTGFQVDHLCRSRACVRPDHLEAVTQAENNRRALAVRYATTGERP